MNTRTARLWPFLLLCGLLLAGCSRNERLEYALRFAGENRSELEKVLELYRYDEEKYAAACFLIENMPHYYSLRGEGIDSVQRTQSKYPIEKVTAPDELAHWQEYDFGREERVYDAHVITAEYLIDNIERAFRAWKGRPWNRGLSFEEFCELLLPYRVGNTQLGDWRESYEKHYGWLLDSLYRGSDVIAATDTVAHFLRKEGFTYCWDYQHPGLGPEFLLKYRVGTCTDACEFALYVYRALGIPIATDMYVYSSETRKGHTWSAVRDTTGHFVGFWFTEQDAIRDSVYSDLRKAGKAFRECFGSQHERLTEILEDKDVPDFFKNLYRKDVSEDYYPDTLRMEVTAEEYGRYAYIGVFNANGWIGIAMAAVKGREAVFPNVEPKVVYAPLSYREGAYRTMDYPFYFDGHRNIPYRPDLTHRDTVQLLRKHPLFRWQQGWLNSMAGCFIELSDTKDFRTVKYSYRIPDTLEVAYNRIKLPRTISCRYLRFRGSKGGVEVAEFECLRNGKAWTPATLDGTQPDNLSRQRKYACDGDPLTSFSALVPGAILVVDYGREIEVDNINFTAYNDDNFIRIGDEYELFYHGGRQGWISLGRRTATDPWLEYDNLPRGALFHLRCLTRGIEEQVFHIENGVQVFVSNQAVIVKRK